MCWNSIRTARAIGDVILISWLFIEEEEDEDEEYRRGIDNVDDDFEFDIADGTTSKLPPLDV